MPYPLNDTDKLPTICSPSLSSFISPLPALKRSLLKGSFFPNESQILGIKTHMTQMDALSNELAEQIQSIQRHKERLQARVREFEACQRELERRKSQVAHVQAIDCSFVSPIRRLPPETLSEIFIFYAADVWISPRNGSLDLILEVCQLWRDVAWADSRVWSFIDFDILSRSAPTVEARLALVKDSELAVRAQSEGRYGLSTNRDLGQTFLSSLEPRLHKLTHLVLGSVRLDGLLPSAISLPRLIYARLALPVNGWIRPDPVINLRVSAPSLRDLDAGDNVLLSIMQDSANLQSLTIRRCSLARANGLQPFLDRYDPCVLTVGFRESLNRSATDKLWIPRRTRIFTYLCWGGIRPGEPILERLSFRSPITKLVVREELYGYVPVRDMLAVCRALLTGFRTLRILHLVDIPDAVLGVVQGRVTFQQLPHLEALTLEHTAAGKRNIDVESSFSGAARALSRDDSLLGDVPCPHLRQLVLKAPVWRNPDTSPLLCFIRSRQNPELESRSRADFAYLRVQLGSNAERSPETQNLFASLDSLLQRFDDPRFPMSTGRWLTTDAFQLGDRIRVRYHDGERELEED